MHRTLLLLPLVAAIAAGDAEAAAPAEAAAAPIVVSPWSHSARLGVFMSNVAVNNQQATNDPAIGGARDTITWLAQFNGALTYAKAEHRVEQTLLLKYGEQKQDRDPFIENSDQIDYDGAYKYSFSTPHYGFVAWGGNSVFSGARPAEEPLDPFTGKVSAGYGQRHELTGRKDHVLDARVGVRAQKTWGRGLTDEQEEVETGLELVVRYEDKPAYLAPNPLSYFAQYEMFTEFDDIGHVRNLLTAGLSLKVAPMLTVDLSLRAYFEAKPDEVTNHDGRYDSWAVRQESLIGLTWDF